MRSKAERSVPVRPSFIAVLVVCVCAFSVKPVNGTLTEWHTVPRTRWPRRIERRRGQREDRVAKSVHGPSVVRCVLHCYSSVTVRLVLCREE
ncbi:hypothetical protein LXA43DRAFT_589429 [Ganoderma leucocontextum]|nr:hypothetical protein LXA43DRAFT_589429 [Ganoderma leucocontextum]